MSRRYAWFRRILKHFDEEDAHLFPPNWEIGRLLATDFAEYTKADLVNVLGKQPPGVNSLLEALQSTLDFESTMSRRFDVPVSKKITSLGPYNQLIPEVCRIGWPGWDALYCFTWQMDDIRRLR